MPKESLEEEIKMLDDEYEKKEEREDEDEEVEKDVKETSESESESESGFEEEKTLEDSADTTESQESTEGETESQEADDLDLTKEDQKKIDEESRKEIEESVETDQVAKLLAEIDRLSGLVASRGEIKEVTSKTEKSKVDMSEDDLIDFVGDLDMDDVASDSKILNAILNKVMKQGIAVGKDLNKNYFDSAVPQVIADQVGRFSQNQLMIDQFYRDNSDLVNVKQVVKACATQVAGENPGKGLEDILKMAADNTRKTLGFPKSKTKTSGSDLKDAAFAQQKGGQRKKVKKLSKLQQELDEL